MCTALKVFEITVDGNFKEVQDQEINLPDDEPRIVEKMLRFLYEKDYDDERDMEITVKDDSIPAAQEDAEVIPSPINPNSSAFNQWSGFGNVLATPKVDAHIKPSWSEESLLINVKVYIIADKNDIAALKELAKEKYVEVLAHLWNTPSFPASAKLLYDNILESDRLLRDAIAETAQENIRTLIDKEDFVEAVISHGELAVDVLKFAFERGG